jgi:hypothetical protein
VAASVIRLSSRARRGEFRAVLPDLLAAADGGSPDDRWAPAAAAITILFWLDRFADAAELAERAIGDASGPVAEQDFPFDLALLAAQEHAGQPAAPRLARIAGLAPAGSNLAEQCGWLAGQVDTRPVAELLPNHSGWGADPKPLDGVPGAEHLTADYAGLSTAQRRQLWSALNRADQGELAWDLAERTGQVPPQWPVCSWLAGWCARTGRVEEGAGVLLAAHDSWTPYAKWDCLPSDLPLQPVLRTLLTEELREQFLTRPIGPEARKRT